MCKLFLGIIANGFKSLGDLEGCGGLDKVLDGGLVKH
jgi:hypothetical protein